MNTTAMTISMNKTSRLLLRALCALTLPAAIAAGPAAIAAPAATDLITNGSFSTWTGRAPAGWIGTPSLAKGIDLGGDAGSNAAFVHRTGEPDAHAFGELRQNFANAIEGDFTLSFDFTLNKQAGWGQNLIVSLYTDTAKFWNSAWLQFRFGGADGGQASPDNDLTGNSYLYLYDDKAEGSKKWFLPPAGVTAVKGSDYNPKAKSFTGAPQIYQATLAYSASANTYSISYGPLNGAKTTHSGIATFGTASKGKGVKGVRFYGGSDGGALVDRVSLLVPAAAANP
ncbi:MAG: hypothetical protein LBC18_01355 [Opitutaceae bacterium]|jgi:hypothetical protein|nr:hypothetical protein [Opitutaceae bacterium]